MGLVCAYLHGLCFWFDLQNLLVCQREQIVERAPAVAVCGRYAPLIHFFPKCKKLNSPTIWLELDL